MQHYAVFDGETPIAFYNDVVHGPKTVPALETVVPDDVRQAPYAVWGEVSDPDCRIPPEAVEITEQQWLQWIGAVP